MNIQGKIIENFGNSTFQDIFMTMFFGTTKADYPCSSAIGAHFSNVPWYLPILPGVFVLLLELHSCFDNS